MNLPNTILLEIFSYIPLPQRWLVARVCQNWNRVCHDPYLFMHLEFKDLEYNVLVQTMQKVIEISPRVKSIRIKGCYSDFVQNTVVPVRFSTMRDSNSPRLFSHISALQPLHRREEYAKCNFQLHDQFSDAIYQLLRMNEKNLSALILENCTLDLEMTELFCAIAGFGHSLETFIYRDNHDKGVCSSGLLQAIVTASPRMRHFIGSHSGMNDTVLSTIARHWKSLESLTLSSLNSREVLGPIEIMSDGRQLTGSSPTGMISSHAVWQLLCKCKQLKKLELFDLACISNHELAIFQTKQRSLQQHRQKRYSPYTIPKNESETIPGADIEHLSITKYMTAPLSKPGFESLLQLFPKLTTLQYKTNFHTFDNLFEGVTRDIFQAECLAVQKYMNYGSILYSGEWHTRITAEQRLMAGMASVSDSSY